MEILKMTNICLTLCSVLMFLICVNAAPSDLLSKLENVTKVERVVKPDNEPNTLIEAGKYDTTAVEQGQRQKRYHRYNYHGYGFPPINPVIYPNYDRYDSGAGFGLEDPFSQIYRRLQDIASVVRQPSPPPSLPNHFPIFFPVIYIPQTGCACNPNQYVPPEQNEPTAPPLTAPAMTVNNNGTNPDVDISNRFPEMEDTNQNWGFVIDEPVEEDDGQEEDYTRPISLEPITPNRTASRQPPAVNNGNSQGGGNVVTDNQIEVNDGREEDFTRPISFQPIKPNRTLSRPPPRVNHGTSQAGQNQGPTTTTMSQPRPTTFRPVTTPAPAPPSPPVEAPTSCDAAVLSCCHQPQVTYDCFAVQGCPDPTSYGNPCEPQVILRVIERFQRFYIEQRG